ncbi:MAG: T9SS type A sorting domain-containing protein [Bacteroidales bacterium]|jgi:hypothetical protein|nr:T9SS type A sorting domain-containing protein [Bacteroidales bacterium]
MKKLLTLAIAICFATTTANAQFSGSGTSADPYQIATAAHLAQLATYVNAETAPYAEAGKYFKLTDDIDLSSYNWTPIGSWSSTNDRPFRGVFDGNTKVISGLQINAVADRMGLFGRISGATIKNLGVENVDINANNFIGAVAGQAVGNSVITNCYSTGHITARGTIGGLVGYIENSSLTNSFSTVNIGAYTMVGGMVGWFLDGTVSNCWSTGEINIVESGNTIGGLVGIVMSFTSSATLNNSVALNPAVRSDGNFIGRVTGGKEGSTATIANNTAFDGMLNFDDNTTWNNIGQDDIDGANITKQAINTDGTIGGRFTAANGWTTENGKLPGLFGKTVEMPEHLFILEFSGGDGSETNPYIITTAEQLAGLAAIVNWVNEDYNGKHYKLGNDIDLSAYGATWNDGKGWIPIGVWNITGGNDYFGGVFDGNHKKITGLYINDKDGDLWCPGLFGSIAYGAVVKNLGVENVDISTLSSAGGIAGFVREASILNCYSTGTISGQYDVGGIVGDVSYGNVSNCYSTANVSGESRRIGGIVGDIRNGSSLSNCYSTGNVNGEEYVGGVAGRLNWESKISNSYSTGTISGQYSVGGVAGYIYNSEIENCYSLGNVSGDISVGGIVGFVDGIFNDVDDERSYIKNCYSVGAVSGKNLVGGIAGEVYDSEISNCAALNPSVKATEGDDVGRIAAYIDGGTLSNNIAWDGMLNTAGNTTWANIGAADLDGENADKEEINADGTLGNRFKTTDGWTTQNGNLPGLQGNTVVMPEHLRLEGMVYITTENLPNGTVGTAYSATLTAEGDLPIAWAIESGNLPNGLSLSTAGVISGTPTSQGTLVFTVKASNSVGSASKTLEITVTEGVGSVETHGRASLQIYPNPTTGQLTIANYELGIKNVEIFNMNGKRVYVAPVGANNHLPLQSTFTIDISSFPTGTYFLRVGSKTTKIVKL